MHPYYHPLFLEFLVYFNENQDYFEGHEVLEEYWKSIPQYSKSHPLTSYILLSTGMYHWRRGNHTGAMRTIDKANDRLNSLHPSYHAFTEEVDFKRLLQDIQATQDKIAAKIAFEAFTIEILSPPLESLMQLKMQHMQLLERNSKDVIHKHMLRDRSDILKIREQNKKSGR